VALYLHYPNTSSWRGAYFTFTTQALLGVGIAQRYSAALRAGRWEGSSPGRGLGIFLLTTASRPALGPTQPSIEWVAGAPSLRVKRQGREADHLHLVPRSRICGVISPVPNTSSWRGAQLRHRNNFTFLLLLLRYFTLPYFYFYTGSC
jgi:hypothetical protein